MTSIARGDHAPVLAILAAAALLALTLSGCVGVAAEGANMTRDRLVVDENTAAAEAGDAVAQYKVGEALCCSLNEGEAFYDTPQSVAWLCRSAAQGYGPASQMLGRIYAGDTVEGVRLLRRVATALSGSSTDLPVAYAWLRRADVQGVAEARAEATSIWESLSDEQKHEANDLTTGAAPLACEWSAVIAG